MPLQRKLTPDELQYLADQGVDTESLANQQVTVMSPQEYGDYSANLQNKNAGMLRGGVLPTLKAHAGSLIGGGLSGTAAMAASEPLGVALAPVTGGLSLVGVPLVAGALASFGGAQVGNAMQKGVVEPMIGMTPQQQAEEERNATLARRNYPVTSVATDVLGGALAGGGAPSLKAPMYALKGIAQLAESGAATGIENQVYKHAVQNVITGNALNTAVNAGVQYATTGKVDPLELGAAAVAGGFMSNPSPLGRALNPRWKPLGTPKGVTAQDAATPITVRDSLSMDPMNIADVEAYKTKARETVDEVQAGNDDYKQQVADYNTRMAELDRQNAEAQQQAEQRRQQYQQTNWMTRQGEEFAIPDTYVKREFVKRYSASTADAPDAIGKAQISEQNKLLKKTPVDEMRQRLFEDDFQQNDPEGFQRYKVRKTVDDAIEKYNAALQEQQRIDEQHAALQKAVAIRRAMDEMAAQQQRAADYPKALAEKQLQDAVAGLPEAMTKGLTVERRPEGEGRQFPTMEHVPMTEAEQIEQRLGTEYQPSQQQGTQPTAEQNQRLLGEAAKHRVEVGEVPEGTIPMPGGGEARGASYDPAQIGRRLIAVAREHATSDTGYHELVHSMIRDLKRSGDPRAQRYAATLERAFGGEEPLAESAGKRYFESVEKTSDNVLGRASEYFKNVWANLKTAMGSTERDVLERNLVAKMRNRAFEDSTLTPEGGAGGGTRYSQLDDDKQRYAELQDRMKQLIKDKMSGGEEFRGLWQEMETLKNRYGGMPPREGPVEGTKYQPYDPYEVKKQYAGYDEHQSNVFNREAVEYREIKRSLDNDPRLAELVRQDYPNESLTTGLKYALMDKVTKTFGRGGNNSSALDHYLQNYYPKLQEFHDVFGSNPELVQHIIKPNATLRKPEEAFGPRYQPITPSKLNPYRYTQSALDRIRTDINDPNGDRVADKLQKVLIGKQNLIGRWVNPTMEALNKLTPEQRQRLDSVLYAEVNDKQSHAGLLRGAAERDAYNVVRRNLLDNAQHRIAIGEPVYRNGQPTPAQIDRWYYPTTTEPRIADIFRQNTDTTAIQRLTQEFLQHQLRHGYTPAEAQQNLKDVVNSFQGSAQHSDSQGNQAFFNAARKAQGIPLPESWRRTDIARNLDAYFRRQAGDNSYYEHVEKDHPVMAALGYTSDPWRQPVNQPNVQNIAGNDAVKAVVNEIKGEFADKTARTQHAVEAVATAAMLGPLTETHKTLSTVSQSMVLADNPMEAAKVFVHAVTHLGEGWTHSKQSGYIQMDSKHASDFLNTHLTAAERLQGLTRAIREVYTLGGLTERFTKSYAQAAGEYLAKSKLVAANGGDAQAQRFMHGVDPDYTLGKTYTPDEMIRLGSEVANVIHGSKDARTLPQWMLHDNEISAFMKLSSWNIAQTNNWVKNVYEPLKQGNFKPLLMSALGATLGGAVIKELREKLAGKASNIPSLAEISASDKGVSGNLPAVAYNWMAMASYAGFAGILSNVAKYPFDIAYKNIPQGATFPLDEVVTNVGNSAVKIAQAFATDPSIKMSDPSSWMNVGSAALVDLLKDNIQLARVALNQGINTGALGKGGLIDTELTRDLAYRKQYSDKTAELRRFKMVSDLPYEAQEGLSGNPYINLEQKRYKHEEDIGAAMERLPSLLNNIIDTYKDRPEVMMEKLKALKQNTYETMPSMEDAPMAFMRYLSFLAKRDGSEAATERLMDYVRHKTVNEVKGAMVP